MPLLHDDSSIGGKTTREKERDERNLALLKEWADEDKPPKTKPNLPESSPFPAQLKKLDNNVYSRYQIAGVDIKCQVCGDSLFFQRHNLINTRLLTLLNLDWVDNGAITLQCRKCGNLLWFYNKTNSGLFLLVVFIGFAVLYACTKGL